MRCGLLTCLMVACCGLTGCRCCCLLNPYASMIDDVSDTHVYFDNWYTPRLDVSRAGRPDWCGPINRRIGRNICYLGCYDWYDDCHVYPPSHPYSYPGGILGESNVWGTPTQTPMPDSPSTPEPLQLPPAPLPTPPEE